MNAATLGVGTEAVGVRVRERVYVAVLAMVGKKRLEREIQTATARHMKEKRVQAADEVDLPKGRLV